MNSEIKDYTLDDWDANWLEEEAPKKSYFSIIDLLDKALPSTTDFDYRGATEQEVWDRVYTFLGQAELLPKMSGADLTNIEYATKAIQRRILDFCEVYQSNTKKEPDQNNQAIKNNLIQLQLKLYTIITNCGKYELCSIDGTGEYKKDIGSNEEIKEHITEEKIEEYITKLLTITKYETAIYHLDTGFYISATLKHFGLDDSPYEYQPIIGELSNEIEQAVAKCAHFYGQRYRDGSYNNVTHNKEQFEQAIKEAAKRIVKAIYTIANKKLEKKITYEKKMEQSRKEWEERKMREAEQQTGIPEIADFKEKEPFTFEESEPVEDFVTSRVEEKVPVITEPVEVRAPEVAKPEEEPTSELTLEDLDRTLKLYDDAEKKIQRNREILRSLQGIQTERIALEKKVAALKEKEEKLKKEFDDNNKVITAGTNHHV